MNRDTPRRITPSSPSQNAQARSADALVASVVGEYDLDLGGAEVFYDAKYTGFGGTSIVDGKARIRTAPRAFYSRQVLASTLFHEKWHSDRHSSHTPDDYLRDPGLNARDEVEAYEAEIPLAQAWGEDWVHINALQGAADSYRDSMWTARTGCAHGWETWTGD